MTGRCAQTSPSAAACALKPRTRIHDHADWAPRLGFAWGIGGAGKSAPKTVLRGGFGLFYDRFADNLVLNADRQNGLTQQQYAISCPQAHRRSRPVDFLSQSAH
jgi:hypothetical protein